MVNGSKRLLIDGKLVRKWLFTRLSKVALPGAIPVDRKEREHTLNMSEQPRFMVNVQVEAFTLDHALERLVELYPFVERKEWQMLEELDPEHDIGMLGARHPLIPIIQLPPTSRRMQ